MDDFRMDFQKKQRIIVLYNRIITIIILVVVILKVNNLEIPKKFEPLYLLLFCISIVINTHYIVLFKNYKKEEKKEEIKKYLNDVNNNMIVIKAVNIKRLDNLLIFYDNRGQIPEKALENVFEIAIKGVPSSVNYSYIKKTYFPYTMLYKVIAQKNGENHVLLIEKNDKGEYEIIKRIKRLYKLYKFI